MKAFEKFRTEYSYLLKQYCYETSCQILIDRYSDDYKKHLSVLINDSFNYSYSLLQFKTLELAFKKELLQVAVNFQKELLKELSE